MNLGLTVLAPHLVATTQTTNTIFSKAGNIEGELIDIDLFDIFLFLAYDCFDDGPTEKFCGLYMNREPPIKNSCCNLCQKVYKMSSDSDWKCQRSGFS